MVECDDQSIRKTVCLTENDIGRKGSLDRNSFLLSPFNSRRDLLIFFFSQQAFLSGMGIQAAHKERYICFTRLAQR